MKFVNIHTHQATKSDGIELINHQAQNEWNTERGRTYSVGFHPWDIKMYDQTQILKRITRLAKLQNVLAIGECGLDRTSDIPIEEQKLIFIKQIEIAEETNKPLIIHSVRTFSDLISIKKIRRHQVPWILHGYRGNEQTTKQLLAHDFYFSFGTNLLNTSTKLTDSLKLIPSDKLFFETDDSPEIIETIYIFASQLLQCSLSELQATILANFKQVFNNE